MQRPKLSTLLIVIAWLVPLFVAVGYLFFYVGNPGRRQFALPLMFWTFFGALVVVAVACAISLPQRQAVFWRALVLSLLAIAAEPHVQLMFMRDAIRTFVPLALQKQLPPLWRGDSEWITLLVWGLTCLIISLVAATISDFVARRTSAPASDRFQVRLLHLFWLAALVGCTLTAWRNDTELSFKLLVLGCTAVRVFAGIMAAAHRGQAMFYWGFLAGSFAWIFVIDYPGLMVEWQGWIPPRMLSAGRLEMLWMLIPTYAGGVTGVLTAILYRPESKPLA